MMGVNPLAIPLTHEYTQYPSVEERVGGLINMREEALAAHEFARQCMLQRITSNSEPFKLGQKVWLEGKNLKTIYNKKIAPKREGPFKITKLLSPLTYSLNLPPTWCIHNVFHTLLLTSYVKNEVHGPNYTRLPAELTEQEEEEWEVERIIGHQKRGRGYQYHVLWKGYPITEATWEPEAVFKHAQEMLHVQRKSRSQQIRFAPHNTSPTCHPKGQIYSNSQIVPTNSNSTNQTPETCKYPHVPSSCAQYPPFLKRNDPMLTDERYKHEINKLINLIDVMLDDSL
jgi:hypothetical protein